MTTLAVEKSFDRDVHAYVSALPDLLKEHDGEFVLVGQAEVAGLFPSRQEAMENGYAKFGARGFLVQEISRQELEMGQNWLQACQS